MADSLQLHRELYQLLKSDPGMAQDLATGWLGSILKAVDQGTPIAYHPFSMFSEIMVALGIQPLCCESWALMDTAPGDTMMNIDVAQEAGIPPELCSFDKAIIGCIMRGRMPRPSMIVLTAMPCQNSYITYQAASLLTGAPMWVSDMPYDMDEKGAMDYWVNQYKGVISFLEEHSGKRMDYDRLKEVVEESNRCVEYWLEATEFLKLKPTPYSGTLGQGTTAGMMCFGTPEGTAAMKALRDQIRDKVARGETAVPDERARAIWFHFPVFWDGTLMAWMAEMGAVVPFVLYDDFRVEPVDTSTPEKMLRGMAWRALQAPMGKLGRGAFDLYLEDLMYAVDEWKGDCVIIGAHPGCKWMSGAYGLVRDACREHGVPLLLYDVDLVDPRITSAEESRVRIEQFLTMVLDRR